MSFADDFGHNIPPDDYSGGGGDYYSPRRGKRYYNNTYNVNPGNRTVEIYYVNKEHTTKKAVLLLFQDDLKYWFPLSKIRLSEFNKTIKLPYWLWLKKIPLKE